MTAHDLDALLDEIDGNGDTVTLFGETWTLPTDVDAETMLRVQRLQMKLALAKRAGVAIADDDIVDDAITLEELVRKMAGDDNYTEWVRRGLGYKAMQVVAGQLYAIHSGDSDGRGKGRSNGPAKRTRKRTATSR